MSIGESRDQEKDAQRAAISAQISDFLNQGGNIKTLPAKPPPGVKRNLTADQQPGE